MKIRWWLDSNRGPLVSEATTLPTELQPLPIDHFNCVVSSVIRAPKLWIFESINKLLKLFPLFLGTNENLNAEIACQLYLNVEDENEKQKPTFLSKSSLLVRF